MAKKLIKAHSTYDDKVRKLETITLKSIKFAMRKKFGRAVIENTSVEILRDEFERFSQSVIMQMESSIYGQKMPMEHQISMLIPATWWHHLVDDHFPKWYRRWFPVKRKEVYRTFTLDHWALLPKFDKVPPGEEIQMFTETYFDEPEIPKDASSK